MKTFDVIKTKLEGRNLIEASAGTGKTYSIALLVVRLIVEKKIDLEKILMVTFTNAAVAELEGRIRKFIKIANGYIFSNKTDGLSAEMKQILDAVDEDDMNTVKEKLKHALLFLDETAIFTIHSFCQRTLTEFAFETNQSFESELMAGTETLVDEAVSNFWREKITVLDKDILMKINDKLSLTHLKKCVANQLNNEEIEAFDEDKVEAFENNYQAACNKKDEVWQKILDYFNKNQGLIIDQSQIGRRKKAFAEIANDSDLFLDSFNEKLINFNKEGKPGYMEEFLPELKKLVNEYFEEEQKQEAVISDTYFYLVAEAINYTRNEIDRKKQQNGILFYNDLITNLHEAVNGPNKEVLVTALNKKYESVFIDEFHDTDKQQYEIFFNLFGNHSTLFLIGDPKQSIYGWRGADLDTYKLAASKSDMFTMDKNFRSTGKYIDAMNALYASVADPFLDDHITYQPVKQGQDVGRLLHGKEEVVPISIITDKNKDEASNKVAWEINNILNGDYYIEDKKGKRKVEPSDIAVLVRKNHQSTLIKKSLTRRGIPAITYDDTHVLKSDEAWGIFYIIGAILNPSKSNINRALATVFTGNTNEDILGLDDDLELERFKKMRDTLTNNGVYGALMEFVKIYRVRKWSLENENGERIISNFLQTAELLQKQQTLKGLSPDQLLNWMQRVFEGESSEGDEYQQRIESDENAVTIATIHKSKGLAYNIVFAPFLNMSYFEKKEPCKNEDPEALKEKEEQENRRLMYVALTRAVYKSFINITTSSRSLGTIHQFESGLNSIEHKLVEKIDVEEPEKKYTSADIEVENLPGIFSGEIDRSWRILSFSGLSKSHASFEREEKEYDTTEYDNFIYNRLPKGIVAGLFLHEIFENIDFTREEGWEQEVLKVGNKYNINITEADKSLFMQLIDNVLKANYKTTFDQFTLDGLTSDKKIHELEFYFDLNEFQTGKLKKLLDNIGIDNHSFNGAMHGFVDLFFEMDGKYYILDWKSNYLGNVVEAYSPAKLDEAMTASNYHLQYLIYTIAVKRFLEKRIPDFDYDKHFGGVFYTFLRGMREGQEEGIFYNKPDATLVEKMDAIFGRTVAEQLN